jgi:hypothetical protein
MSYATYLSNRLASQQKVVNVRKPTDASMITQKRRFEANTVFFADGQGVGSLAMDTSRPTGTPLLQHASVSVRKSSTRPADASAYTSFRGAQGIRDDAAYSGIARKTLPCAPEIEIDGSRYKTAADVTRDKLACDTSNALLDPPKFVDTTIRLSAMQTDMVTGACAITRSEPATHTHSPGLPIGAQKQDFAVTQHTFMAAPPEFQNKGVGGARIGAYYTPKSGYVENKHGNDLNVNPRRTPGPWVYSPGAPAHLKINRPTLFRIKPEA